MKDRSDELTAAAIAARAPGLVMMSCDDNLVFEKETLGRAWASDTQLWHSNDNANWPTDIAG
jgi:hypothetical protein